MTQSLTNARDLAAIDIECLLHPATSIADHLKNGPRIMHSAQGVYVTDSNGKRYLDGAAGLWCVNIGYGREEITRAIAEQASKISYFHSFTSMSNEPSILLAERVLAWAPECMSKVLFGSGGSDANDTNVKLIWYYNNLRGLPRKKKIIARDRAYHGVTVASGSLTGLPINHDAFDLPLPMVKHTKSVDSYRERPDGMSDEQFSAYLADALEAMILEEGPDTVAAFIAEPVMGTGGVLPPPSGYFQAIQVVLDKYDILMVADEVVCGFGRLGSAFGSTKYGIKPDLMTVAKGLSSGYLPISASIIGDRIWSVLRDTAPNMPAFGHGFTYSAHPLCAAAALTNLDIIEREGLVANAAVAGEQLINHLRQEIGDHPLVGDIRGSGLVVGLELVADRAKKTVIPLELKAGARLVAKGYDNGILVRPLPHRNVIALSPPLTFTNDNIGELVAGIKRSLEQLTPELSF